MAPPPPPAPPAASAAAASFLTEAKRAAMHAKAKRREESTSKQFSEALRSVSGKLVRGGKPLKKWEGKTALIFTDGAGKWFVKEVEQKDFGSNKSFYAVRFTKTGKLKILNQRVRVYPKNISTNGVFEERKSRIPTAVAMDSLRNIRFDQLPAKERKRVAQARDYLTKRIPGKDGAKIKFVPFETGTAKGQVSIKGDKLTYNPTKTFQTKKVSSKTGLNLDPLFDGIAKELMRGMAEIKSQSIWTVQAVALVNGPEGKFAINLESDQFSAFKFFKQNGRNNPLKLKEPEGATRKTLVSALAGSLYSKIRKQLGAMGLVSISSTRRMSETAENRDEDREDWQLMNGRPWQGRDKKDCQILGISFRLKLIFK